MKNINENMENMENNNFIIIRYPNDKFELNKYIGKINNKIIYSIKGEWNLDKKKLIININDKNIKIKNNNNIYTYKNENDIKIIYKNQEICADIIIDNHVDELKVKKINNDYIFYRNLEDEFIEKIEDKKKDNEYNVKIIKKEDEKYNELFFITFIILDQMNKELNISFDKIL
jgi:hypothetical protein